MPLYKRKPVQPVPDPKVKDDHTEVWVIPQSGEAFTEYEQFLKRRDWYSQRIFTCIVTGHSGLSYFEALESEAEGSRDVEQAFPEALKGPVLRRVQHSVVSRLDELVNQVYDAYKDEYFPGEHVIFTDDVGVKHEGILREKSTFPARLRPDGTIESRGFSKFNFQADGSNDTGVQVDSYNITRDRNVFTKQRLKTFLKNSIEREAWNGAPWEVKADLCNQFRISSVKPPHLHRQLRPAGHKKGRAAPKKTEAEQNQQGTFMNWHLDITDGEQTNRFQDSRTAARRSIGHGIEVQHPQGFGVFDSTSGSPSVNGVNGIQVMGPNGPVNYAGLLNVHDMGSPYAGPGFIQLSGGAIAGFRQQMFAPPQHPPVGPYPLITNYFTPLPPQSIPTEPRIHVPYTTGWTPTPTRLPTPPPPKPVIKYPIEDLMIEPRENPTVSVRPELKFVSETFSLKTAELESNIRMESVGPLLEAWNTLNVFAQHFYLDSFTFDDFVEAMQFSSPDIECELFSEVHCAVLKEIVNEKGQILVKLPEMLEESEEEDSTMEDSVVSTPAVEPEPPRRTTRSSLAKAEAAALKEPTPAPTPEPEMMHRAVEMTAEYGWVERLQARDFGNGGWQTIVVGLLYQLSLDDRDKERCDKILQHLAPRDMEPIPDTARSQYVALDVNLRITALEIIVMLAIRTTAVKQYLDHQSDDMTVFRKQKIEYQRTKKTVKDELKSLEDDWKIMLPDNLPPSPKEEPEELEDSVMTGVDDPSGAASDNEAEGGRTLRRATDRANERKRKRDEEKARNDKAKNEQAAKNKQTAAFKSLLKKIDHKKAQIKKLEDKIAECDEDLRQAACQRTKALGRDRFWNRYWWFERNGMPFGGLSDSSTASYGYANGRIWVQGPSEMEREGFIDLPEAKIVEFTKITGMTIPERQEKEEGPIRLHNATEWGYIDDPKDVEKLMDWLDERGERERALKKELTTYKEPIVKHMEALQAHLAENEEKRAGGEEQATRVSTRHKTYVDMTSTKYRCLAYKNGAAVRKFGHRHYQPAKPKVKKGVAEVVKKKEKETKMVTRVKPLPAPARSTRSRA